MIIKDRNEPRGMIEPLKNIRDRATVQQGYSGLPIVFSGHFNATSNVPVSRKNSFCRILRDQKMSGDIRTDGIIPLNMLIDRQTMQDMMVKGSNFGEGNRIATP